jgi:hypothetical protein
MGAIASRTWRDRNPEVETETRVEIGGLAGLTGMTLLSRHLALRLDFTTLFLRASGRNVTVPVEITLGLTWFVTPLATFR